MQLDVHPRDRHVLLGGREPARGRARRPGSPRRRRGPPVGDGERDRDRATASHRHDRDEPRRAVDAIVAPPAGDRRDQQRVDQPRRRSVTPHTPATDARRQRQPVVHLRDPEAPPAEARRAATRSRIHRPPSTARRRRAPTRSGRPGRRTTGREQPEQRRSKPPTIAMSAVHASAPNSKIQYSVAPKNASPKTNPRSSPRRGRASAQRPEKGRARRTRGATGRAGGNASEQPGRRPRSGRSASRERGHGAAQAQSRQSICFLSASWLRCFTR